MNRAVELLNDKDSVLVFDVDGVLALIEWGTNTHYDFAGKEWTDAYANNKCLYTDGYAIKKIQDFLKDRDKSRVYVISKVYIDDEIEDKKNFVFRNYGILSDHVFCVLNNSEKIEKLNEIKALYPELEDEKIIMIDDTVDVLTQVMDNTKFSTVHVSTFLDL